MPFKRHFFAALVLLVCSPGFADVLPDSSPVKPPAAPSVVPPVVPVVVPPAAPLAMPLAVVPPIAPVVAPAVPLPPPLAPSPVIPLKPSVDVPAPESDARLLRGNDRVLGAAKPSVPVTGPATAFKFEEAPIVDVIHIVLRDVLKVDYLLHQPITGSVTLATRSEVSPDQAISLLESALQANGLLMAQDARGIYHIGRPEALKGIVTAPRQVGNGPLPPGYGTVIIPLEYIGATEMASILRPMLAPEALVRVDTLRNLLVLAGTRTQAEGWLDIAATFDVNMLKGMSIGVFPLKYASTRDVEAALNLMAPSGGGLTVAAPGTPGAPVASLATTGSAATSTDAISFFGALRILPMERMNSIIVVTPRAAYLEEARRWIERLDRPGNSGSESQLFVYPVQNGSAKHLATVLSGIFGVDSKQSSGSTGSGVSPGLTSSAGTTSGFGSSTTGGTGGLAGVLNAAARPATSATSGSVQNQGVTAVNLMQGVRLVADEINNAVLIYSSQLEYNKIEATLKRLDVPPTQVLIEASIIEVTLNDDLQYGLQWAFSDKSRGGFNGGGSLSTLGGALTSAVTKGFSYTLSNSLGNVSAVLSALADKSLVKVISSPSVMVLDNHTASITVGTQQPIRSSETVSTTTAVLSTSIVYKDTGVSLAVTPSVSSGNVVTLQINQGVTDVGAVDSATNQRAFLQRQINSKVAIRSGETLVLGGLIRDNTTTGKSGLPGLQDIPLFGALFGTNTTNVARTELLVVITPRVVRSDQDVREVSIELRDRMKSFSTFDAAHRAQLPRFSQEPNPFLSPPFKGAIAP